MRFITLRERGLFRGSNPGPPAPEAGIIPLDQTATPAYAAGMPQESEKNRSPVTATIKMILVGLEPTISGSVDRCLIHWATGPVDVYSLPLKSWGN